MSGLERELKFDAGFDDELPSFSGLRVSDRRDVVLTATYWDTRDRRLTAWGCSLRHRTASDDSESGWTLKIPSARAEGDVTARHEVTRDGPPDAPPAFLTALVRTVLLGDRPLAVAAITTHRSITELVGADGVASVQLADDRVESEVDGRPGPTFRQIEAELVGPGSSSLLHDVGAQLRDAGFEPSTIGSKVRRVLGSRPSLLEAPKRLPADATVRDFLVATVGASTRQMMINDPGVRLGVDVEAIHQARVATRRLRSDLKTFGPLFAAGSVDPLRVELAWLGGLMGEVRDPQVLVGRLVDRAAWLDAPASGDGRIDHALVSEVTDVLSGRSAFHHAQLVSAMDGDRYGALVADLLRLANDPPVVSDKVASKPAAPIARKLARRQWKRARRFARSLGPEPDDVELHDLRKRLKRARYAAQSAQRLRLGTKDFRRELADLQDLLGDHHDLVVQREFLATDVGRLGSEAAFLAGRLLQDADQGRRSVVSAWPELADRLARLDFD